MADTIKDILETFKNSTQGKQAQEYALADIKRIIEEAKPENKIMTNSGKTTQKWEYAGYNSAVYRYHENLLKALEG